MGPSGRFALSLSLPFLPFYHLHLTTFFPSQDPPGYWDQIVWPAYISAHRPLFVKGDVEHGTFDSTKIDGVVLLEAGEMDDMVEKACQAIYERVRSGKTAKDWSCP